MKYEGQSMWIARMSYAVAVVLGPLLFLDSAPNGAFLALATALLALLAWYCLLVWYAPRLALKGRDRTGFLLVMIFAPLVLWLESNGRFNAIEMAWPYALSCLACLPFVIGIGVKSSRKVRPLRLVLLATLICAMMPGLLLYSGLTFANAFWVKEPVAVHVATIAQLKTTRSRSTESRWLGLDRPVNDHSGFYLSPAEYEGREVGDAACIAEYRGLLSMTWYSLQDCGA